MQYMRGKRKQQHYTTPTESAALEDKRVIKNDDRGNNMSSGGTNGKSSASNEDKRNLEAMNTKKRKRGHSYTESEGSRDEDKDMMNGDEPDGMIPPLRMLL